MPKGRGGKDAAPGKRRCSPAQQRCRAGRAPAGQEGPSPRCKPGSEGGAAVPGPAGTESPAGRHGLSRRAPAAQSSEEPARRAGRRAERRRGGERRERRQPRAREGSAGSRCRPRLRTWAAARRVAPGPARRRHRAWRPAWRSAACCCCPPAYCCPRAPGGPGRRPAINGESPASLTSGKMATVEPVSRDPRAPVR